MSSLFWEYNSPVLLEFLHSLVSNAKKLDLKSTSIFVFFYKELCENKSLLYLFISGEYFYDSHVQLWKWQTRSLHFWECNKIPAVLDTFQIIYCSTKTTCWHLLFYLFRWNWSHLGGMYNCFNIYFKLVGSI